MLPDDLLAGNCIFFSIDLETGGENCDIVQLLAVAFKLDGTQLKLHQPHRLRRMPPRPFGHYATVLQDGDKLRLYYRGDKVPGAHWRNGWGKYHEGEVTWTLPVHVPADLDPGEYEVSGFVC